MPVEHSLTADLVVAVVALIALVVSLLTFLDSYRYRRTVTEAQLAVKCHPGAEDNLEILVVNIGAGIAYDVTFSEYPEESITEGSGAWNLDLGDLLPIEQRVVMRISADELESMSTVMVGLSYETGYQHTYPGVRAENLKAPRYQRRINFRQWAYEMKRRKRN